MNTPICDFINEYIKSNSLRLHMPGHKGKNKLGFEEYDITEIDGADSLYEANGIIKESEQNAGSLFGCNTFYSTEGSSLCIRAMIYLVALYAKEFKKNPVIAAGRNAHKTFLSAAAMADFDVQWLYPEEESSYLSCKITAQSLENAINQAEIKPAAVYLTSPDYLGSTADLRSISDVCRKHGILLVIDNAHGAYLKFLPESLHPIDLGADMCCDSAHKTLPVLTGGAYLHISENAENILMQNAKNALALFGSTSPSYLILQSLDMANKYISDGYKENLSGFCKRIRKLKEKLISHGYTLYGDEPLKITVSTKPYGYRGTEIADILAKKNIICEFCDPDFIVFMLNPETEESELISFEEAMISIEQKAEITEKPPIFAKPETAISIRDAVFSTNETIPANQSCGRILSAANVACPPAVPIVVCGERINEKAIRCFEYYGIKECTIIKGR